MKSIVGSAAFALLVMAGAASADVSTINSMAFNTYESFRNPAAPIASNLSLNGGPALPGGFNGNTAIPSLAGTHSVRETYAVGTGGYANRHIAWLSNDGGNTAYTLTGSESFRVSACFTLTPSANYPTGIGAPVNAETGFWIHNPRVNEQGASFIDEGGVWLISNGTSFSGGAGMDFNLYGEGGFNNPSAPPIVFSGDTIEISYTYYAAGALGPGQHARYEATVNNVTRGISVSSGLKGFNPISGSGEDGLNAGATMGFRFQNQIFPLIETDITTNVFNISVVPTPGAAAVFGLAGIFAGRRRR